MRQLTPLLRRFRHELTKFPLAFHKNWSYRRILFLLRDIYCLLTCAGETVSAQLLVSSEKRILRAADVMAKKTEVNNLGANSAIIYESGVIVAIAAPGQTVTLSLSGRFVIEAKCGDGLSTLLEISTHRRCECGDGYVAPYGQAVQPIGGDLI